VRGVGGACARAGDGAGLSDPVGDGESLKISNSSCEGVNAGEEFMELLPGGELGMVWNAT